MPVRPRGSGFLPHAGACVWRDPGAGSGEKSKPRRHLYDHRQRLTPNANQVDPYAALGWLFFDGNGNCQMSGKQFTNQGGFADFNFGCTS